MNRKIFELALEKTRSSDWEYFEKLSSNFLASEFSSLRTMASPSGDGGRDSELFSPNGITYVAAQYSVAKDWDAKIRKTITRLSENFDEINVLIYTTNQIIGANGDAIKQKCLNSGVSLDIRDQSWFLERFELDDAKYSAAYTLVDVIAKPYLESEKIFKKSRPSLSSIESKAALTYLGMQWEDESTDKGLTKIVFESLVRAALRNTNSDKRLSRNEIYNLIFEFLPSSIHEEVKKNIDSALSRLTKKSIRHWTKEDEFCLTHEEFQRLKKRLVDLECEETEFYREIERLVKNEKQDSDHVTDDNTPDIADRILRIIDAYLVKTGESFASSVVSGNVCLSDANTLKNCIFEDINKFASNEPYIKHLPDIALNVVARILSSGNMSVISHLKKISDTYTLYSFLQETPDIQKVTKKIFSHGKIWLDTTVILPLIAETFQKNEDNRKFVTIVKALNESGIELRVTVGVVREILQHINYSLACSRKNAQQWSGRIPFLFFHYVEQGYEPSRFSSATELFHGRSRPEEDIGDYLKENFNISVESLEEAAVHVDETIRFNIERLWKDAHEKRRGDIANQSADNSITEALIKHDVESYVGIIGLRKNETVSELGYKHWWLTIDSLAWKIRNTLKDELDNPPSSPLMSLDFLANTLIFGPSRTNFDRKHEEMLPLFLEAGASEYMPKELIEIADRVRTKNEGLPEHVIRRKVRDACDRMKRRYGKITQDAIDDKVQC